jgi:peptide-methionine (S)-S-oxide reductase
MLWGVEAAFRRVAGVVATRVGYTGGTLAIPLCSLLGGTGHAEAVEVTFDPGRSVMTICYTLGGP